MTLDYLSTARGYRNSEVREIIQSRNARPYSNWKRSFLVLVIVLFLYSWDILQRKEKSIFLTLS